MPRTVDTVLPIDLGATLGPLRHGGGDPCTVIGPGGVWRASWFAGGPATTHFRALGPRRVAVMAWGPGAGDALDAAPALLGADDDDGGLAACAHPVVRRLARSRPALRLCRSGNVLEALVPAVLEQKVQGVVARRAYRAMVRAFATAAPASDTGPRLLLPPTAAWLTAQPSWTWHRWGVERRRAATIGNAAAVVARCTDTPQLRALPGVGVWTAAEVAAVAWGDPDAVSVGDYWLKHWVCHTLAGEPRGTDERMLELLEPWRGPAPLRASLTARRHPRALTRGGSGRCWGRVHVVGNDCALIDVGRAICPGCNVNKCTRSRAWLRASASNVNRCTRSRARHRASASNVNKCTRSRARLRASASSVNDCTRLGEGRPSRPASSVS